MSATHQAFRLWGGVWFSALHLRETRLSHLNCRTTAASSASGYFSFHSMTTWLDPGRAYTHAFTTALDFDTLRRLATHIFRFTFFGLFYASKIRGMQQCNNTRPRSETEIRYWTLDSPIVTFPSSSSPNTARGGFLWRDLSSDVVALSTVATTIIFFRRPRSPLRMINDDLTT